ncbi:MAG: formylglycine-generating enzyme family protein [Xanthomonadales bacterium]|mgnify:CR=1 FL=1|nr:formylglycine-generating enzyme family protein [Xanthomonadales bacterium]ODU93954.1 MAG: sulfatase-modifying factor protein [Rhodanobacter sp. SCN 66-43]OJY82661.1 MAG: sulfatase-modifying factor protein [Xanthomonadales bacterium 66-474]
MPNPQSVTRQHAIGGAIGVLLLVFALVYRFFPAALKVEPAILKSHSHTTSGAPSRAATAPPRLTPAESELNAGPPISLAPTAVIAARAREGSFGVAGNGKISELLAAAGKAARGGNLAGPDKDSALALVLEAVRQAPEDPHVKSAVSLLHARLVANAQQSLASGDADAARAGLEALKQLPGRDGDIAALSARIDAADKVQPLLEQASELVQKDKLEGPGDDTALAVYRKVLILDPENVVARQGLQRVQQAALDRALTAAAQNNDAKADAALADAAAILPSSSALAQTRTRIVAMRGGRADNLMVQAQSALDAGNLDLALKLADQAGTLGASTDAFLARVENAREYASYHPGQVFTDHFLDIVGQAPAMVVVPRGSFLMGAPQRSRSQTSAEQPHHEVTIAKGFALARAEVTVAEFRVFVRTSGYVPDSDRLGGASVYDEANGRMQMRSGAGWQDDYAGQRARDNDPVVNVSWNDAHAYAEWLSRHTGKRYRLPTEAEYEYSERAGTTTTYWWGEGTPKQKVENLTGSGDRSPSHRSWANAFSGYNDGYWGPAPVMSFLANPFGLYDMSGNVSEWVVDCWHENYVRAPTDGSAWVNPGCGERVIRGGSWGSAPDQDRSSFRQGATADTRSGRVGFRVARDL